MSDKIERFNPVDPICIGSEEMVSHPNGMYIKYEEYQKLINKTNSRPDIIFNVLDKGFVRYIDHMGDDISIVESARVSYNQPSKGIEKDKKLLAYLYNNEHSSPMEMVKIKFEIKMPLFVAAQYNRHRMQNLNYVSFRYTEPEQDDFYIPEVWRRQSTHNKQVSTIDENWQPEVEYEGVIYEGHENVSNGINELCTDLMMTYRSLVDSGVGREMARIILPQNLYTRCYSCWDLNNLIKFFKLRDHSHAQWEIQQYAKAMKQITKQFFPILLDIYENQ